MHDFLIVGAGLFGSVFARYAADHNKKVLIIDKRSHIAGMCYSEKIEGVEVHKYGPHLFHTNNKEIWDFVNRFSNFNSFQQRTKVNYKDRIYSFPINLMTLYQIWGITTPNQAIEKLESVRIKIEKPNNLEEWIISQVGEELYEIFIKGYTEKQWGRPAKELPSFIIQRLPIRLTYDDRYFSDQFQGIPEDGYTKMFENMLDHKNIEIELNCDFFSNSFNYKNLVYSGKIDEFFNYKYGRLDYRSLRFETDVVNGDFQGNSIINFTDANVPYTRIIEHKHFVYGNQERSVITKEFPDAYDVTKVPFYPIQDEKNKMLYEKYKMKSKESNLIFGGRLGTYKYYDMHQIIAQALSKAKESLS